MAPSGHDPCTKCFPSDAVTVELCINRLTLRHRLLVHNHLNVELNEEHPLGALLTFSVFGLFYCKDDCLVSGSQPHVDLLFLQVYGETNKWSQNTETFITVVPVSFQYTPHTSCISCDHVALRSCATGTESNLFDRTLYTSTGCLLVLTRFSFRIRLFKVS